MMGGSFLGRNDWCHFFLKSVAFKSSRLKPAIFFGLAKGNLSTQSLAEGQRQWERQ